MLVQPSGQVSEPASDGMHTVSQSESLTLAFSNGPLVPSETCHVLYSEEEAGLECKMQLTAGFTKREAFSKSVWPHKESTIILNSKKKPGRETSIN